MFASISLVNVLCVASAVIFGLASRNALTALCTGFWAAAVHTGLVMLVLAQAGTVAAPALPYYNDLLEKVLQSPYAAFAHAPLIGYLAVMAIALMLLTLVAYLVRFVIASILGLGRAKGVTA